MRITARHYRSGEPVDVCINGGRIESVVPSDASLQADGPWVAPGLIDVQVNGFGGAGPEAGDPHGWRTVASRLTGHGVTAFLPTFCTTSHEAFIAGLRAWRELVESDPTLAHQMPGVHVEGPYISDQDGPRGAHPRSHTRDPDLAEIDAFTRACGDRLAILTLAPERAGAIDAIAELHHRGVIVAIGHTAASAEQIDAAVRAGARLSTHLGNGSHVMLNRHRNYFLDQLADDRLWASVIPDGHHVPDALFRVICRAKGLARLLLTSDSVSLAGEPAGLYHGGRIRITEAGRIELADQPGLLAGSWISLDVGVGRAVKMAGLTLGEAIDLCTIQPARLLGWPDRGRLEAGAVADLILFNWDPDACRMDVTGTILQGEPFTGEHEPKTQEPPAPAGGWSRSRNANLS